MRLIQCIHDNKLQVAVVENEQSVRLIGVEGGTYQLALQAIASGQPLRQLAEELLTEVRLDYQQLVDGKKLLPPVTHPDPARCTVTGTGLTHLGSADTRDAMHSQLNDSSDLTDSMKMFQLGLENGKPQFDKPGAQPEWFYKGNGNTVFGPEQTLPVPPFAEDAGEEPELTALYINDGNGTPCRIGFAVGNEFSDHVTERFNYLWLAHSKLRACSFGPELLLGDLPEHLEGSSRIVRNGEVVWEKAFLTGEENMAHSIANLEGHHFKYDQFRVPGDLHVHFLGTATLSFADNFCSQDGDSFEISIPEFGRPLRNTMQREPEANYCVRVL